MCCSWFVLINYFACENAHAYPFVKACYTHVLTLIQFGPLMTAILIKCIVKMTVQRVEVCYLFVFGSFKQKILA